MCFDLDGTLLNEEHRVSDRNRKAISAAEDAGYSIALCTGRGPTMYMPNKSELGVAGDLHVVCYNGALVGRVGANGSVEHWMFENQMSPAQVKKVLDLSEGLVVELDIGPTQYVNNASLSPSQQAQLDEHVACTKASPVSVQSFDGLPPPNKVTVLTHDPWGFIQKANSIPDFEADGIGLIVGGPFWIETVVLARDKAAGVQLLCDEMHAATSDCVYFGDGGNDAVALGLAGLGIAMANAQPKAKKLANKVSEWSNVEDGVGREIELLLGH